MPIGHQLPLGRETFERLTLQNAVVAPIEIIEHAPMKNEEAGIDPAIENRLFVELLDAAGLADIAGANRCAAANAVEPRSQRQRALNDSGEARIVVGVGQRQRAGAVPG